ncbi:hypothetical protein CSHISOI_07964 [Colletotrichum shisoi]|uniref:Uncharacterized protein n=1 Tax=Colletotrichum shisoi TaxID=2078593 RepID=A0A5Q4BKH6_9PEZI|nr:hypothetical protein CSHISOI_07964 [Colletotrichum shisoi]
MSVSLHDYRLIPGMNPLRCSLYVSICRPHEENRIDTFLETTPNNSDSIILFSTNGDLKFIGDGCSKKQDKQEVFAKAVNRKILSLPMTDGSDAAHEFVDAQNGQRKWANCGARKFLQPRRAYTDHC